MKIVVPFPGGDQIVILHAFVGLRKIRYQSNGGGPALEVISRVGKFLALIHVNDIMPRESQTHLLVESIYATQNLNRLEALWCGLNLWLIR